MLLGPLKPRTPHLLGLFAALALPLLPVNSIQTTYMTLYQVLTNKCTHAGSADSSMQVLTVYFDGAY